MRTKIVAAASLAVTVILTIGVAAHARSSSLDRRGVESNREILQRVIAEARGWTAVELEAMPTITPIPFQLPESGVDVMRAKVKETYAVDGVGTDTVELKGWIAVQHGRPRPSDERTAVTWDSAVIDTEFVAMDLRGHSDIFGEVRVELDPTHRSLGQVGNIACPVADGWTRSGTHPAEVVR
jgi:hypothetical protein